MTRYLPIVLMVLAALGAGVAIVPGAWEMAFMKLRDKDFAAAERVFEDKFLAGDRSREVLLPLSELYVRTGRIDKAIDVLSKFSNAHPDDREVVSRLAVLLTEAQQTSRAVETLEKLSASEPTPEALRELDRLHDIGEDPEGRIRALMNLAKAGSATPKESLTLTNLLAATGRKAEALTAAFNALRQYETKTPHTLVQVFAALAADSGRHDLIAKEVMKWASGQTLVPPLAAVASALVDKNAGSQAISMVEASAAFAAYDPAAIVLAAQLHTAHGSKDKALAHYENLLSKKRLPPERDADYVMLALGLNRTDAALALILARGPHSFSDAVLLYAIGRAAQEKNTAWLNETDAALATHGARPLPSARLALAMGDPGRALTLAKQADAQGPTIILAQLYTELGDLAAAARTFDASVTDAEAVSTQELSQATGVAIALKRETTALALAERLVVQDKSADATIQRVRALTLNGRSAEALEILEQLNAKSELADLAKIEALVAAKRHTELRNLVLAKLSNNSLPQGQRTNLIFLLNDLKLPMGPDTAKLADGLASELDDQSVSGAPREARLTLLARIAPAKALPFMKSAALADPDTQGYAYAKLLKDMRRTDDLRSFLLTAAQAAKAAKVRDDYLYELMKHGAGREVLPLLASRAKAEGQKWFFAYDEALAKYGTRAERLASLQAFADLTDTPRNLRSQIAFQLLNLGDKARAERLFRALAERSGPSSPEVRQLAYLWGPRPAPEARAWLRARATSAPQAERPAWAALLVNAGDSAGAEAALAGATGSQSSAALAAIFAETRNVKALNILIESQLPGADGELAKALAQAADALSLSASASLAYERAGMPAQAGRAAFFAGDHKRALSLLRHADNNPETAFYLAETLTAQERSGEAAPHYRAAIAGLGHGGEAQKMRVVALARLRDHAGAERALAEMAEDAKDQDEARQAYTGALLDQGDTRRAAALLGQ